MREPEEWTKNWEAWGQWLQGAVTQAREEMTTQAEAIATNLEAQLQELESQLEPTLADLEAKAQEALEAVEQQIQTVLAPLDQQLGKTLESVDRQVEAIADTLEREVIIPTLTPLMEELERLTTPVNQTLDPWFNGHRACIGCRYYHGQAYGGSMLVCALYPYGPEEPQCPDWESVWPSDSP